MIYRRLSCKADNKDAHFQIVRNDTDFLPIINQVQQMSMLAISNIPPVSFGHSNLLIR